MADISKVSDLIGGISEASEQQARGIADVNNGLRQIDQVNQSNAAAAEQSAAAASELSTQSQNLRDLLARPGRGSPGSPSRRPRSADALRSFHEALSEIWTTGRP